MYSLHRTTCKRSASGRRLWRIFREIYRQVDVIITPATALAAQPIPQGGIPDGWSDLGTETEMMRFIVPGNLVRPAGDQLPGRLR